MKRIFYLLNENDDYILKKEEVDALSTDDVMAQEEIHNGGSIMPFVLKQEYSDAKRRRTKEIWLVFGR